MLNKVEPKRLGDLDDSEQADFVQLQLTFASSALTLRRNGRDCCLYTDACYIQVGCVLFQPDDDKSLRSVVHWSRTLFSAECNNDTTERKFLAIVW